MPSLQYRVWNDNFEEKVYYWVLVLLLLQFFKDIFDAVQMIYLVQVMFIRF